MSFNPEGGGPEMPSSDSDYPFDELGSDDFYGLFRSFDSEGEDLDSEEGEAWYALGADELGGDPLEPGSGGFSVGAAAGLAAAAVALGLGAWRVYKLYKKERDS